MGTMRESRSPEWRRYMVPRLDHQRRALWGRPAGERDRADRVRSELTQYVETRWPQATRRVRIFGPLGEEGG